MAFQLFLWLYDYQLLRLLINLYSFTTFNFAYFYGQFLWLCNYQHWSGFTNFYSFTITNFTDFYDF